ncbi:GNAT family N-acetyltransferase [Stappia sp. ICDLI1TA098]
MREKSEPPAIRRALADDLEIVRGITSRAYAAWVPVLGYPPLPVEEDYAPRIARGEVHLACDGEGAALGLIVMETDAPDFDLIYSVAVAPEHAGRGLGPLMMTEMEERARQAGKREMRLYTNALMERNIALYTRLGYVETGRRPNAARPGFFRVDMAKELAPA